MRHFKWVIFSCVCSLKLSALPVGSPAEYSLYYYDCCDDGSRDCFNFGVGFYGDYVFNRHLETVHGKDIDTAQLFTNAAYLVGSYCEWLELFTTFGASRLALNTSLGAFSVADPRPLFEAESLSSFSFSVGSRATLLNYRCFLWGVEGQYFRTEPRIKRLYIASGASTYPDDRLKTWYSEWQVATTLAYRYNEFFLPYVALKYADAYWKLNDGNLFIIEDNDTTFLHNLRSNRHFGYALGLTFCPLYCERLLVTAEARFLDEKAFHINAQMRF